MIQTTRAFRRAQCVVVAFGLALLAAPALAETGSLPALPDLPATEPVGLGANAACDTAPDIRLWHLPPALMLLSLSAPCRAGEPLQISHGALGFAVVLDDKGRFTATIPALADPAELSVTFGGGARVTASVPVPDLASVTRLVLNARAAPGLHLSADLPATGAQGPRRVDHQTPGLPTLAGGGFLTRLGDTSSPAPHLAEVLTLPVASDGAQLAVTAEVGPANCDRDLLLMLALGKAAQPVATGAISLSMPACDASGERLVIGDESLRRLLTVAAAP